MDNSTEETLDFIKFLDLNVDVNKIQDITRSLDEEVRSAHNVIKEVRLMYKSLSNPNNRSDIIDNMRHEDLFKFLESKGPELLPSEMATASDIDVEEVDELITNVKRHVENIKKNINLIESQVKKPPSGVENIEMDKYLSSIELVKKRLSNIKLKSNKECQRNLELENKFSLLCQDVNMFSKMIEAKLALSKCNENWSKAIPRSTSFQYHNIINQLLSGISEITYLLENKVYK